MFYPFSVLADDECLDDDWGVTATAGRYSGNNPDFDDEDGGHVDAYGQGRTGSPTHSFIITGHERGGQTMK